MSDAPTPSSSPVTTENRSATGPRGSMGLAIAAVIVGVLPLLALALGGAIKLESLGAVTTAVYAGIALTAAGFILALAATIVNARGLAHGSILKTAISGVMLVVMVLFSALVVIPRVSNIQNLQNTIVPFAEKIRDNCKTPLNTETDHYKKVLADTPSISASEDPATIVQQLGTFATALSADIHMFQQDAQNLQTNLTNLQNLSVPVSKYQALHDGCIKDVQSTIAFLNSTSGVPTDQFLQTITGPNGIPALPDSIMPKAAKPIAIALVKANTPASYSATGLLQAAAQYATCANPFGTCSVQLTIPPGVPASAITSDFKTVYYVVLGGGYAQFVQGAMTQAANSTDPQLTAEGNQLTQDIKDTLRNNLAPLNVDVDKIVQ